MDHLKDSLSQFLLRDSRRTQIRHETQEGNTSLRSIVDRLKQSEPGRRTEITALTDDLISRLRQEVVNIEPKTAELLSVLYDSLHEQYPWVRALVMFGSAAHTGALVRTKLQQEYPVHDLDWGVITDEISIWLSARIMRL